MQDQKAREQQEGIMSKLLIDEYPLQVLPSLAKAIGLNEAIVLQQIHYWLRHAKVEHEGKMWIYKTYAEWKDQDFSFWSVDTIKRTVTSLKKQDLLLVSKLSSNSFNRVNHYTVNYDKLAEITLKQASKPATTDNSKLPQSEVAESIEHSSNLPSSDSSNLPSSLRDNKETLKENTKESGPAPITDDVIAVRNKNAESIINWQAPTKQEMQTQLFMAGSPMEMTDDQFTFHIEDFKAYFEQQAADGKPLKTDSLKKSKFRNWLQNVAQILPSKEQQEAAARPHTSRSDSFKSVAATKTLSRAERIAANIAAMPKSKQAGVPS